MILAILKDVASMRCRSDRMAHRVRVIVTQDNNQFNASIPEKCPSERTEQNLKFVLSLPHIYCGTHAHIDTHTSTCHTSTRTYK